uniref:PEP-CTERM system TPR-repeat lipoprotein n=1 Tax=Candidozyma auris TaxID=498019 RepID=A0A0L0P0L0_CANAR
MSVKQLLKLAKAAIERNDPEDALYYANEALKEDKTNYFAYIFKGKSYQLTDEYDKAKKAFERAIDLEPDQLLGWKGYFQIARSQNDYDQFFDIFTKYVQKLVDQDVGTGDAVKDLYNYLHAHKYHENTELHEKFLRSILPGEPLRELLGDAVGKEDETIKRLITVVKNRQDEQCRTLLAKEKMRMPRALTTQHKAQLHALEWKIRLGSDLASLYKMILDVSDDDDLRRAYEADLLKYQYNMLKLSPSKTQLIDEIKQLCSDMVLIGTKDLFAWTLHFDLQDPKNLADLDEREVLQFVKEFRNEGLGVFMYAFLLSDLGPFDKNKVQKELGLMDLSKDLQANGGDQDIDGAPRDETPEPSPVISPSEILEMMLEGYSRATNSMMAHRIICCYFINLQEYEAGSGKCTAAIRHLAELQRSYGLDLANCKRDILCLLATIYTYHEAPKNFARALELYNKILESDPENTQAMIGKGLILLEKMELEHAREALSKVIEKFPNDTTALSEFGWCLVLQKDYEKGRMHLQKALEGLKDASLKTLEANAAIKWRLAKSYIWEDESNTTNVQTAYDLLISSLKDSNTYAPSFTLLGVLYHDHLNEKRRAQKCFYKAFELDVGEITAAKYLVTELTEKNEWEVSDILCKRVVTSDKSRRILFSQLNDDPDRSWPYRALGCSALNRQDDAKAIEWFQTALRMKAMDVQCWIGLGEAYYNCGRIDAAIKVFKRTSKMDPSSWTLKYMLGVATCEIGDYKEGLAILDEALTDRPDEECLLNAVYEQSIGYSAQLLLGGFTGRTLKVINVALNTIARAVKVERASQNLWRALGQCLKLRLTVQLGVESFPFDTVVEVLEHARLPNDEFVSVKKAQVLISSSKFIEAIAMLNVLAAKSAVALLPAKAIRFQRSVAFYNLGLAFLDAFNCSNERDFQYRDEAIAALKQAIKLENNNSQYWLALGNGFVSKNPEIAQHCFIKASVLDTKDAQVWTNLAALYLRYGESDLAQEAFDRATSVAPERAQSWLGNALTADARDDRNTASKLFTHAYIISMGRLPLAQLCYATSIVNSRIGNAKDSRDVEAAQEFSIANFAIQSYLKFSPNDEVGLRLAILLSERCHTYQLAIEAGQRLCQILERRYEETECESVLVGYAQAKAELARVFLGLARYEEAIDNAQVALDVLAEEDETEKIKKVKLSSRVVIGLSFFFNEQFDDAIEELKVILSTHGQSQRIVTLIAQVLNAYGTNETKQAALDQLFAFIEEHGSSLLVVLTLGAISVVDKLEDYYEPIKEELLSLSLKELIADSFRMVPQLLSEIEDASKKRGVWQKFAMLFPCDFNVWKNLNSKMALDTALLPTSKRPAYDLANAYVERGSRREVQRALLICANLDRAREALA